MLSPAPSPSYVYQIPGPTLDRIFRKHASESGLSPRRTTTRRTPRMIRTSVFDGLFGLTFEFVSKEVGFKVPGDIKFSFRLLSVRSLSPPRHIYLSLSIPIPSPSNSSPSPFTTPATSISTAVTVTGTCIGASAVSLHPKIHPIILFRWPPRLKLQPEPKLISGSASPHISSLLTWCAASMSAEIWPRTLPLFVLWLYSNANVLVYLGPW